MADRLVLLGVGSKEDFDAGVLRTGILKAVRHLKVKDLQRLGVYCPGVGELSDEVQAIVEGAVMGTFSTGLYKSENSEPVKIGELVLVSDSDVSGLKNRVRNRAEEGLILGESINLARTLTYEPGNRLNPLGFASRASDIAAECGLDLQVFDRKKLDKLGMKALLGVAQGSTQPPCLVVLKHLPGPDEEKPIVLVGKGVTFDSGGLSLKPSASMEEMKGDKAGACAVLAAMQAITKLQAPRNVVGLIPLVENMPGGTAQRPGDVVETFSGKTVEVINTDAEGRLILADTLAYAVESFSPEWILDIATLTGACVVALGHLRAGFFVNDTKLAEAFDRAAGRSGEKLWRLPLDHAYRKDLESKIADVKNVGGRWGGAITAAKFLQEFVADTPWCHIDMAGVESFPANGVLEGPTGFGVRTLFELAFDR
jgi:leucyl aminopeptidase